MMASMVAKTSTSSCSQLSPLSIQEKGSRNKRKFRADPPTSDPHKVSPSTTNDGTSYEFSAEKFEMAASHAHPPSPCDVCGVCQDHSDNLKLDLGLSSASLGGSSEVGSSHPREEEEHDDFQDADWSDLTETQLEELVLSNLDTIFKSAIKKIVAYGYTEAVATRAVLRSGLCYGSKDTVSNIVDHALVFLRNGQDISPLREHCFEDLQQLEKYVLAELVCVLQEVRPFFSTGDAMWCLLICDMNVSHACAMDSDPLSSLISEGSPNDSSTNQPHSHLKAESKSIEMSLPSPSKAVASNVNQTGKHKVAGVPNLTKPKNTNVPKGTTASKERSTSSQPNSIDKPFSAVGVSHTLSPEEKSVSSRKTHSGNSKRESILRQKSIHLEKSCRSYGAKGSFRTAKFSGYILDKRIRPTSDSATLNMKSASLKISKAMAMGLELAHENGSLSFSACSTISSTSPSFTVEARRTVSSSPETNQTSVTSVAKTKPDVSAADTELSLSLPAKSNPPQVNQSCNSEASIPSAADIPYDKSLAQWVPQDKKDEVIMKLVPRIRELQHQLQEWTEWANQKVMQAARRLSKDKAELKNLRQEKEEVERLKKEKQSLEENTMKKLSEMENALGKASEKVDLANAAVRRLKVENASLRQEMEDAKVRAVESAASCQEVSKREKKTLIKFQSWEKQKSIFQEELATEKRKLSQLQQELEQARDLYNQLEARWKQEEKAKEELLVQANSIKKEREQLEASAKSKEDAIKLKSEANLQKYKGDIQKLEKEISQLRLKTDSSKIAAMKRGIDGNFASRLTEAQSAPAAKESRNTHKSRIANGFQEFTAVGGVKRERECVMCLSEEMSVVFLPCAHQVVCKMCNELHEKQGMNDCPSCRSPISRRICVPFAHP
ncbi:putative E3 ubiquitin-protein ligase RF298 [Chenopodium quinoa]|uniref:putative E3 ubiquitin-protein ligase RF298 n=1 Tax=Chenopodium quinoa TaxID=63459 RepID=UPI000B76E8A6|nr:putative E3 ubiquitin-protein ligase RF298 [Chenopodium quinoa]